MSERRRSHTIFSILLEVVLISVGVFLAMWASSWQEAREHRELAFSALRNFAGEMRANQAAVQSERDYHEKLARELLAFLASKEPPTEERFDQTVHLEGVHPITFEHTAWDLALATQALSYVEPELAFDISRVYTRQTAFQTLQGSFLSAAYSPTSFAGDSPKALATAMQVYLGDVNTQEPGILKLYQQILPKVDRALTSSSSR